MENIEKLYRGDAFGNELHVGDTVVAATQIIQSMCYLTVRL